jgi:hypothetical protein
VKVVIEQLAKLSCSEEEFRRSERSLVVLGSALILRVRTVI